VPPRNDLHPARGPSGPSVGVPPARESFTANRENAGGLSLPGWTAPRTGAAAPSNKHRCVRGPTRTAAVASSLRFASSPRCQTARQWTGTRKNDSKQMWTSPRVGGGAADGVDRGAAFLSGGRHRRVATRYGDTNDRPGVGPSPPAKAPHRPSPPTRQGSRNSRPGTGGRPPRGADPSADPNGTGKTERSARRQTPVQPRRGEPAHVRSNHRPVFGSARTNDPGPFTAAPVGLDLLSLPVRGISPRCRPSGGQPQTNRKEQRKSPSGTRRHLQSHTQRLFRRKVPPAALLGRLR